MTVYEITPRHMFTELSSLKVTVTIDKVKILTKTVIATTLSRTGQKLLLTYVFDLCPHKVYIIFLPKDFQAITFLDTDIKQACLYCNVHE